jgi:hypothetical protein
VERFPYLAAHRNTETRVQNFSINPFQPITLQALLESEEQLVQLSSIVRAELLSPHEPKRDSYSVMLGTEPLFKNFAVFNLGEYALEFTFEEYQLGGYAEGRQRIYVPFDMLKPIIKPDIFDMIVQQDGI